MFSKHFRSGFREDKKKMCNIFKENALNITMACNLALNNFLGVTFDLKCGTYYP